MNPAVLAAAISSGARPPSGPTSRADGAAGSAASECSPSGANTTPPPRHVSSQARSVATARISGTRLRPHCSHAATAICRQCASRLSQRSPGGSGPLRSVSSGWIAETPSSVALRTARSIASLAATACASVTASGDSRSVASNASMRTAASRLPTSAIVAAYSPPVPVNSVNASPAPSRTTRIA